MYFSTYNYDNYKFVNCLFHYDSVAKTTLSGPGPEPFVKRS